MSRDVKGDALLEVENLTVQRQRDVLLSDVSMIVERGSVHVVVGRNGAGKSTLLSSVLGLIPFEGRIVAHWCRDGRIGFVPQSFSVDRTLPLTVQDFLALTRQRRPVCLGVGRDARDRISALLQQVGLSGLERRPLAVLSGGELRRVLLANALNPVPELLILDEPASGLDDAAVRRLEDVLRTLRNKGQTTVLMVSHDFDQVRRIADRVTVLDRHVVADAPAATMMEREAAWVVHASAGPPPPQ